MESLRIEPGPGAPEGLVIPAADLTEKFAKSSGPGGQGVNTTDSKVQLSMDLGSTSALSANQRERVIQALGHRLDGTVLTISSTEHRSQIRNRKEARARMATIIRDALAPPVPRRKTRPTRASVRRRLDAKRRRSELKSLRKRLRPGRNDA
ncbi:ribosome-associated protein [Trueperella bonasi]|uniref:Ribosome-associated protein n=1 Tax=Trueperella bonasi TaxID=312286 RepID=A0ABT9NFA7_9ACTO|nr:alternative ribosome rescue aminoacyl-tRNA hydrolase ArfB [Trueperella bonasi]MDP9806081.1 ribosome-associated protein [Trueperella bonasi]